MKTLLALLLAGVAVVSAADKPKVSQCFKVRALLKADEEHYWADWANNCPYTIDSVYVMVGFSDRYRKHLGDGVWPLYFVTPGTHRVTRFSVPVGVSGFRTVSVHKITTDSVEALR
jgi:hypothetical protein